MPRIPDANSLGERPTPRSQRAIASYRGGIAEEAQVRAGAALSEVGEGISKAAAFIQKDYENLENFETQRKLLEFSSGVEAEFDQNKQQVAPGAPEFAKSWMDRFNGKAGEFLEKNVPPRLRPELEVKIEGMRGRYRENATTFEVGERQGHYKTQIGELAKTVGGAVRNDPDSYDGRIGQVDEMIQASGLPPRARLEIRRAAEDALIQDRIFGLASKGRNDEARSISNDYQARRQKEYDAAVSAPADVRAAIDEAAGATGIPAGYLYTVAKKESSLNPKAQASTSSAGGLFQFIDKTWERTLEKHGDKYGYGPDTPKTDARANALMAAEFTKENAAVLRSSGIPVNSKTLYLAHFAGAEGATKLLRAGSEAEAADVLPAAAKANPTIFYSGGASRTVGQVVGRLTAGFNADAQPPKQVAAAGGATASDAEEDIPSATGGTQVASAGGGAGRGGAKGHDFAQWTERVIGYHETQRQKAATQASAAKGEQYERAILEAERGATPLLSRTQIENDTTLTEDKRNTLLRSYDKAAGDALPLQQGITKLGQPGAVWNPRDEDDKKRLAAVDIKTGLVGELQTGNPQAIAVASDRFAETGMVSNAVKGTIEGMIRGGDDKQLEAAMETLDRMYRQNPNAFSEAFEKDTAKTLAAWQSRANQPTGAFREMLKRASDPATVKAREAASEVARKQVKDMSDDKILSVLDESWFSDPEKPIGTKEAPGMAVYREQYSELYAEGYAASDGNAEAAQRFADRQIKQTWSVSPSGGGRVMMHAPETLPDSLFPTVNGRKDWMKKQVEDVVFQRTGAVRADPMTGVSERPEVAPPVYGLVALPGTAAEIEAVKAGRPLPNGRKSPAWALVYIDPETQLPKQELFYFDVESVQTEREKLRTERGARHSDAVRRQIENDAYPTSMSIGAP
jgi:hypothetical protein